LTIASGGSIGREGAMVQLSAMMASVVGKRFHLSKPRVRLMVACGAAAGIASAYNAPIAGALFVAEIILGSISMETFGPLAFSSVVASLTIRHLISAEPLFGTPSFQLVSFAEMGAYLVLGLVAGALAPWFLRVLRASERFFTAWGSPSYVRLAAGG